MKKEKEGPIHPKKGKPAGAEKSKTGLKSLIAQEEWEDDIHLAEKYAHASSELAKNMHVLHPNRHNRKKEDFPIKESVIEQKRNSFAPFEMQPAELQGVLNKELFTVLADFKNNLCISIYIPTHRRGMEVNEQADPVTFKNALKEAEKKLNESYVVKPLINALLKPGYDLLDNEEFWHNTTEGLAVFIAENHFDYVRLPFNPGLSVLLNKSFYLVPLAEIIFKKEYFYILMITKRQIKFYLANMYGIKNLVIPELPDGIDDVVHFEEKDDQKLFRAGGGPAAGNANFHGIGAGKPDEKKNIALYLKEVDRTLQKELRHAAKAPLLLVGADYIVSIYREICSYQNLWPESVVHPERDTSDAELHNAAVKLMQPYFNKAREKALEQYGNLSASPLTTSLPTRIIPAAHYGRIDSLFVLKNMHIWGTFDEANNQLFMHGEKKNNDDCLVNAAVIKTILNGGNVFVLNKEAMPEHSTMAAILRY